MTADSYYRVTSSQQDNTSLIVQDANSGSNVHTFKTTDGGGAGREREECSLKRQRCHVQLLRSAD